MYSLIIDKLDANSIVQYMRVGSREYKVIIYSFIPQKASQRRLSMLDLNKLSAQVRAASFEFTEHHSQSQARLTEALLSFSKAQTQSSQMVHHLLKYELPWTVARPLEALEKVTPLPSLPNKYSVLATDGSQISPSRHEVSPCYLINIGKIVYTYGTGSQALQESEPFLYYRQQDLYTQKGWKQVSINESMIGLERSLMETQELANLLHKAPEEFPRLAMMDGALFGFLIDLQNENTELQTLAIGRFKEAFETFKTHAVPVCAYISESRKADCVHFLRLARCPFETPLCENQCEAGQEECRGLSPMTDATLWQHLLQEGERSPLMTNTQKLPPSLKEHELCFFYLHVGSEVARIEMPRWVADMPQGLDKVHALVYAQAQKGQGYPIALAEAHHRAVIKSQDRSQFYAMLSYKMMSKGFGVNLSHKELKKRKGIV